MTYDQTHWIPVQRREPLPTFYYHEHFVEMLDFVLAEITDKNGAVYSALDAEAEQVHGATGVVVDLEVLAVGVRHRGRVRHDLRDDQVTRAEDRAELRWDPKKSLRGTLGLFIDDDRVTTWTYVVAKLTWRF